MDVELSARRASAQVVSSYSRAVIMTCADCGCVVDRGVRLSTCGNPACCCRALPRREELDAMAAEIRAAFQARDLTRFGALLADDARWGDDTAPNRCRSRDEVVATFQCLLAEGVDGAVADLEIGAAGILCHLRIQWPGPSADWRRDEVFHLYRVVDGQISEIEPYDNADEARAGLAAT